MGLIVALDTAEIALANNILQQTRSQIALLKISHVLLASSSSAELDELIGNMPLFLDLKWFDIPNTVELAIEAYLTRFPSLTYFTFHGVGSDEMVKVAANYADKALSVISLSSQLTDQQHFIAQAERNFQLGIRGFICPGYFLRAMRQRFGAEITLITPGIRQQTAAQDHLFVTTVEQAKKEGATHWVVGRPILTSQTPYQTIQTYL